VLEDGGYGRGIADALAACVSLLPRRPTRCSSRTTCPILPLSRPWSKYDGGGGEEVGWGCENLATVGDTEPLTAKDSVRSEGFGLSSLAETACQRRKEQKGAGLSGHGFAPWPSSSIQLPPHPSTKGNLRTILSIKVGTTVLTVGVSIAITHTPSIPLRSVAPTAWAGRGEAKLAS
jgi:hypothetical protein